MRLTPGWALAAIAAAIAIPSLAWGDPPPTSASIYAYDRGFEDAPGSGNSTVTIAPGGTVDFSYPIGGNFHNVVFDQDQPTSCTQTSGVDVGSVPPLPAIPLGPGWDGSCRFDTEGTYAFHCQAHPLEMTGTVVVTADASPSPTTSATATASATATTSATATATTSATATATTTASASPSATASAGPTASPTATVTANPALAAAPTPSATVGASSGGGTPSGPTATAAQLARTQHGATVRGSLEVTRGGSRLQVDVLAKRSALGSRGSGQARVGHVTRTVGAGRASFAVPLTAAAKQALRRRHKLPVTVKLTVKPPTGPTFTASRSVTLKP